MSPLTRVLIKIFVKGFYRAHSGMLLFFFVTVITYCFFVEVLNKTHLPESEIALNHLIIVLAIITSPFILILVAALWLGYTVKTWQYIKLELGAVSNQFLYYSSTSLPRISQFRSWLVAQLVLSIPILIYSGFALIVGLVYGHYWLPIVFIAYIVLIAIISAIIHVVRANSLNPERRLPSFLMMAQAWRKPFCTLYLFQIMNEQRIGWLVAKLFSLSVLAASSYLLLAQERNLSVGGITTLGIVVAHSFLIYDSFRFEKSFLNFSLNLPYSKSKVYFDWVFCYLILTLPESIWLLYKFEMKIGVVLLSFNLVTGILYRTFLYKVSMGVNRFLQMVFITFVSFFLGILMGLIIPIIALNLVLSIVLFEKYYYQQKSVSNG